MHELRQGKSTPASRKPSAAEEAFAGASIKAFNHNATATWAGNPGIGCIVRTSSFHVSHMSAFRPKTRIQTFVQNVFNEAAYLMAMSRSLLKRARQASLGYEAMRPL